MKLWQKDKVALESVEQFTVGKDREMDAYLAPFDVLGSMAHITMLQSIGLLDATELKILKQELRNIYQEIQAGNFKLEEGVEDIHSQVELLLTRRLGEVGKKIHSGRSRNDQVLVDLKLFLRHELQDIVSEVLALFHLLQQQSETYKNRLMPGYTHLQIAMPSSFGLWFGAYAESLVDDLTMLQGAYKVVNKNPLGSAAGYGSSFPLDRTLTTALLGFDTLNYNVVYAQMGRGKTEKLVAFALSGIAATVAKMAMDMTLFMNQNFGFVSFPDELTTGSSIMPHKKNPDVWELIRSHGNKLQALPNEIAMMITNLPSGYHRDLQLLKENLFPAFQTLKDCLRMSRLMLENIRIKDQILDDEKYQYLFSVEVVNNLVLQGVPFREAYKQVGLDIEKGTFSPAKEVNHTHEGSIGNLCTAEIKAQMEAVVKGFPFESVDKAIERLLND
ncbi:argininosuccinate lyase [Chitinophaga terrae (ex Kim and Jung 2007)]|uniref:Argininosuccinate lyase n=1 Tax=Chitinophaga terrae (ex Kim and Jung 2007) TaxID=408074 RepID=A0A1H4E450_9BACT|nr:argininosuccinate lyase [Chitinophaga terrae (ex Kim and Jung 2007)]MDQ0108248.1 argininosuccinate lyase [Chitinophaga terrae (ex Kim and Jung 2007)]GEP91447.1 argininosuccinate lyase [Chitinophaga terrae (ex Kim and Jung 2007)]SEA79162.1 argininosuccinate lyase [Chitinophaga terrae (ex Kim and Jung 2007)]